MRLQGPACLQQTGPSLLISVNASTHGGTLVKVSVFAVASVNFLATSSVALAQMKCTVNDPTGTPLNVRSRPNGPIVGALHNGTRVLLWELVYVGDKPWAKITIEGPGKSGWAFRQYLSCKQLYD